VHACNPSYSEGGEQEDCSLRQPQAKKLLRPPHLNQQAGNFGVQL
jgi:hypothetical protein